MITRFAIWFVDGRGRALAAMPLLSYLVASLVNADMERALCQGEKRRRQQLAAALNRPGPPSFN